MRTREDWRRAVFRSKAIPDSTRVLLLYLADHMRANRTVSIPREQIAADLQRAERRLDERFASAHAAGFLATVAKGYRGHVAVYQGTFPNPQSTTGSSTHSGAHSPTEPSGHSLPKSVRHSTLESPTPGGRTTSTANFSASGYDRNVGIDDEAVG